MTHVALRRTLAAATALLLLGGITAPALAEQAPPLTAYEQPASQTFTPLDDDGVEDAVEAQWLFGEPADVSWTVTDGDGLPLAEGTSTTLPPGPDDGGWTAPFRWDGTTGAGSAPIGQHRLTWSALGDVTGTGTSGTAVLEVTDHPSPTAAFVVPGEGATVASGDPVELALSGKGCDAPDTPWVCGASGGELATTAGARFSSDGAQPDTTTFLGVTVTADAGNVADGPVDVVGTVYWVDVHRHVHRATTAPRRYTATSTASVEVRSSPEVVFPNAVDWYDAAHAAVELRLGRSGDVLVEVLSGSTVVRSWTVPLGAGRQFVRWDGRRTDGTVAPEGSYALRASTAGLSDSVQLDVSHVVPTVVMTPADGAAVTGPVEVAVTASGGPLLESLQVSGFDGSGGSAGLLYETSETPVATLGATVDPTARLSGSTSVTVWAALVDALGGRLSPELGRTWQVTARNVVTGDTDPATVGAAPVSSPWSASRSGTARVTVRTPAGQVVRQLDGGTPLEVDGGALQTSSWDGTDEVGQRVPAGPYVLRVTATSTSGLEGTHERPLTVADIGTIPTISAPEPGSTLSGPVVVTVSAPPGRQISSAHVFRRTGPSTGASIGTERGLRDPGQLVDSISFDVDARQLPVGPLVLFARAVLDGSETSTPTPDVAYTVAAAPVVDTAPWELTVRVGQPATASWTVDRTSPVTVVLEDAAGTVVRTYADAVTTPADVPQELQVDGTDATGARLPTGDYLLRFTPEGGSDVTRPVAIDSTVLPAPQVGPDPYDPDATDQVMVTWEPPAGTTPTTVQLQADGDYVTSLYDWLSTGTWQAGLDTDSLGDGSHELTVSAYLDGTEYTSEATTLVVANGLEITYQFPDSEPLDPEDPVSGPWRASVSTSQPADLVWTVRRGDAPVRTGTATSFWNSSTSIAWDGRDDEGVAVPDGTYAVTVVATPPGDTEQHVTGGPMEVVVDRTRPGSITAPAAATTVQTGGQVVFTEAPGTAVSYVTALVRGRADVSWALTRQPDGTWTGTTDWNDLPDGSWTIDVSASWTDAQDRWRYTGVAGPEVVLRHGRLLTTAPVDAHGSPLSGDLLVHDAATDAGDGATLTARLRLARDADVTVEVLSGQTVVATPRATAPAPAGPLTVTWDATGPDGPLPTGRYVLRTTAVDAAGSDRRDLPVDVLAAPPVSLTGVPAGDAKGLVTMTATGAEGVAPYGGALGLYVGTMREVGLDPREGSSGALYPLDTRTVDNGAYELRGSVHWRDRFGGYHSTALADQPFGIDNGMRFTGVPGPRTIVAGDPSDGHYRGQVTLNQNAPLVVTVLDSEGRVVRVLDEVVAGRQLAWYDAATFTWDGTDGTEGAAPVADGTYVLRMVATDPYKGTTATEQVEVGVTRARPGYVVAPQPGQGLSSFMDVGFEETLGSGVAEVTAVQVSGSRMAPVSLKKSELFADWMDSIDTRRLVNGGDRLLFEVSWTDTSGSPHVYRQSVDVVPDNDPELTLTSASGTFSPAGNGVSESFRVSYTSVACAPVRGEVTDATGTVVRAMPPSTACSGSHQRVWDGRDDSGLIVPDGSYTVTMLTGRYALSRTAVVETDPVLAWSLADGAVVSDVLPVTVTETATGAGVVSDLQVGVLNRTDLVPMTRGPAGWTADVDLPATIRGDLVVEVRGTWTDADDRQHAVQLTRAVRTNETDLTLTSVDLGRAGEAPFEYVLQVEASALQGPVEWRISPEGQDPLTGSGASPLRVTRSLDLLEPGQYDVLVEVFDAQGRRRHLTRTVDVLPPANRRPSIVLGTPSRTTGTASPERPFDVTIPVTAADEDGEVSRLVVEWGDGEPETVAGNPESISHSYTAGGGYTVSVTAEDDAGSSSGDTTTLVVDDDAPLSARSSAPAGTVVTVDGAEVVFDASGSQPAAAISSYAWSFSDGTTADGPTVRHAFAEPGAHSGTVTVTRDDGGDPAVSTYVQQVEVLDRDEASVSTVQVTGAGEATVAYVDADGGVQTVPTTRGEAVLYGLPEGDSTVAAFADGFRATDGTVTVTDGTGSGTVVLEAGELASAELTARQLSPDDVRDAGIDPDAVENKHVFQLSISIPYLVNGQSRPLQIDAFQAGDQLLLPKWGGPGSEPEHNLCQGIDEDGRIVGVICRNAGGGGGVLQLKAVENGGQPQLVMLSLSGEASMMKEFYNVDLRVENLSSSSLARITDGVATLELGPGLVLAPTPTPQSLRAEVPDIASRSSQGASWIVRGDDPGATFVRASFRGELEPFGARVEVDTERADIRVYGPSAVQVVVQASPEQKKDRPFVVRMGLKNVTTDAVVYNATLSLEPDVDWVTPLPREETSRVDQILPGETWWAPDWTFIWEKDDAQLDLSQLPAGAIGRTSASGAVPPPADGSSDVIEALAAADDPAQQDLTLTQAPGQDGQVDLSWTPVEGASYQVMQSQPGGTGYVPVGPLVTGTSASVPVADVFPQASAFATLRTRTAALRTMAAETGDTTRKLVVATVVKGASSIRHNQVHASPPYATTTVDYGNWRLRGDVNKTAEGWIARGSVALNGLVITPKGDTKLELNSTTGVLRSSGGVVLGLTLGGKTVDLGELPAFTWSLKGPVATRVVDAVLLGLAVKQAVENAANLTLTAPAPGKLAIAAQLLPPPLVAAAPAEATLLVDTAGGVTVEDAKVTWPDAVLGTLGRGSLELALTGSGAEWSVTGETVAGGDITGDLAFDVDGNLVSGSFSAAKVAPLGLIGLDTLSLATTGGSSWTVSGSGGGQSVTGSLTTGTDGMVTAGSLSATKATVPGLTTFTGVSASLAGGTWTVSASKPALTGSLTVAQGRLTGGSVTATDLPVAGVVTAKSLALSYDAATSSYSGAGTFLTPGEQSFTGTLKVVDGTLVDTSLAGSRLTLGPLDVTTPKVAYTAAGEQWQVSGAKSTLGTLISVSSFRATRTGTPEGASTLELDGVTGAGSVSGSLTTDATGAVTAGHVASTRLQVGLLDLPDFRVEKAGSAWSGSTGSGETLKEFSFGYDDAGALTSGRVHAATMDVVGIGTVKGLTFGYEDGTWTASSTAPVLGGSLTVVDGQVTGGTLTAATLPVMGLFAARDLELAYRPADSTYSGQVSLDVPGKQDATTVTLVVKQGAIDSVDLTLPDLPVVGLASARGLHVTWDRSGSTKLTAEHADVVGLLSIDGFTLERPGDGRPFHLSGDYTAPGTKGRVEADLTLVDGAVTGGSIALTGLNLGGVLPLGDVTLGYRDGGWSFGASGAPLHLVVQDGKLATGGVRLPEVRLADAFSMGRAELSFADGLWSGTLDGPTVEFGLSKVEFGYDEQGLVRGALEGSLPLVPGWGLRGMKASYDRATDSWSGALTVAFPNATVGGSISVKAGVLEKIGVKGEGRVTVAPGLSLTGVTGDLTLNPFDLKGTATFGIGPAVAGVSSLAEATGSFSVTADAAGASSWKGGAVVKLGGLPLEAGASLGYEHPAGTASLSGQVALGVRGTAFVGARLDARFSAARPAFSVSASGEVHVLGQQASGTVTVTEQGFGGCAALEVLGKDQRGGFFQHWSGARDTMGVCDSAPFADLPGAAASDTGSLRTQSRASLRSMSLTTAAAPTSFGLAGGHANAVLRFVGADAPPTVEVRDPSGTVTGTSLVDGTTTYVVLVDPPGGSWSYAVVEGALSSAPAASVPLPEPEVSAGEPTLSDDGHATVTWSLLPLPGQEVRFVEKAPDGTTQVLESATGASGELTFVPLPGDGTHVVVAQVLQGGLVREELEVAEFQVGEVTPEPSATASASASAEPSATASATTSAEPSATATATAEPSASAVPTTGGGGTGGGTGGGGGVPQPPVPTLTAGPTPSAPGRTTTVPAGGTASSDAGTAPVDATDPLRVDVTVPDGGTVTLDEQDGGLGTVQVEAPDASVLRPLLLAFSVHASRMPAGVLPADVTVTRDGVPAADCAGPGAVPDPCVASRSFDGEVLRLEVRSSHASSWTVVDDRVGRLAGADRLATAVEVSRASYPAGGAGAVVLARADGFADALAGTPLAAELDGPLLLTPTGALSPTTLAELRRVLPQGGAVHLLGGSQALAPSIEEAVRLLGYRIVRHAGADRYATAVEVAAALGSPSRVLLATGLDAADSLAAGVAAGRSGGVVLLTAGSMLPTATADYLAVHPGERIAVGGPAAAALPQAARVVGADRYATAALLAGLSSSTGAGLASGISWADALAAGPQLVRRDEPLLLSGPAGLPEVTRTALVGAERVHLYGGTAVLGHAVEAQVAALVP